MLRRFAPYLLFASLVCVFLWRPIFTGRALLPGDYLAQMLPWRSQISGAGFETPHQKEMGPQDQQTGPQWNPMQWDAIAQFYPWRVFYARSMRAGHIPLWNPHQFCGTPFLANAQSAVLYPLNLVFLVFDPITAFTVYAALHLFLAMAFVHQLMRELGRSTVAGILAGIVFAFSAFMVLWLELPTFVGAAVWLPLALLLIHRAVERRSLFNGMLSGLALAMPFFAGHFQIAFYVLLGAMLWWLWKLVEVLRAEGQLYAILRVVVPFVGCAAILCLIAAPQVLPTVELARNSHRVREVTAEGYRRFIGNALPAYRLITVFVPDYFGNPSKDDYELLGHVDGHIGSAADYMEYGTYAGVLGFILALVGLAGAPRVRYAGYFGVLAAVALLTAMGTPINYLFYYGVPGFSALGGPNRMLMLYLFGVAGLAGYGFDRISSLLARASGERVSRSTRAFPALAVILIAADLFAFGINYNPTCERSSVYPETKLTRFLQKHAHNCRIAPINPKWSLFQTPEAILPPNAAMVYGLYDIQGYDSLYTRAYKDRIDRMQGMDSSPVENGNMVLVKDYTQRLEEVAGFIVTTQRLEGVAGVRLAAVIDGVRVYKLTGSQRVTARLPYEPFSFRFGLYLMMVGVWALACVGTYRLARSRQAPR